MKIEVLTDNIVAQITATSDSALSNSFFTDTDNYLPQNVKDQFDAADRADQTGIPYDDYEVPDLKNIVGLNNFEATDLQQSN